MGESTIIDIRQLEINQFTNATSKITFTLASRLSREEARRKRNRCFNDSLLPVTPKAAVTLIPQQYKNITQ